MVGIQGLIKYQRGAFWQLEMYEISDNRDIKLNPTLIKIFAMTTVSISLNQTYHIMNELKIYGKVCYPL